MPSQPAPGLAELREPFLILYLHPLGVTGYCLFGFGFMLLKNKMTILKCGQGGKRKAKEAIMSCIFKWRIIYCICMSRNTVESWLKIGLEWLTTYTNTVFNIHYYAHTLKERTNWYGKLYAEGDR